MAWGEGLLVSERTHGELKLDRPRVFRQLLRGTTAMVALTACQASDGRSPEPVELQPGPGRIHITGQPMTWPADLVIRLADADGEPGSTTTTDIPAGAAIEAGRWTLPGVQWLIVDDVRCRGAVSVESEQQTNVTLRIAEGSCDAETTSIGPLPSS